MKVNIWLSDLNQFLDTFHPQDEEVARNPNLAPITYTGSLLQPRHQQSTSLLRTLELNPSLLFDTKRLTTFGSTKITMAQTRNNKKHASSRL